MMTESITLQELYVVLLTVGARERWSAAGSSLDGASFAGGWLIAFAIVALILSVILVVRTFVKYSRTENLLRQKISELTVTNKHIQREIAETKKELLEILQNIINNTEPQEKDILEIDAQQIKALSELSMRLQ